MSKTVTTSSQSYAQLGTFIKISKGKKPLVLLEREEHGTVPYLIADYFRTGYIKQYAKINDETSIVKCTKDNIILIWDGSNAGEVFTGYSGALASTMVKIEPIAPLTRMFLFYFLKGKFNELNTQTTGSTIPHVSGKVLTSIPVPLFSAFEQNAIARALRAVQDAKDARRRELELERERKAALMQHLFTHGTQGEATKQTEIGEMPESWQVVKLGKVAKIERGKFTHRPRNDPAFYGGTTPFIQTGDVTASSGRITTFSQTLNELGLTVSKIFPKGTIVITIAANIGYTGILEFDSAFPDSLIAITPNTNVDVAYLNYYLSLQQPEMDRKAPRGTQKNINIEFLDPWPVILPTLAEQREISRALTACEDKILALEHENELLDELFRAMLEELMTGRLSAVPLIEGDQAE